MVHAKPMGEDFTFFVVYGRVNHLVDPTHGRGRRARLPAADAQGGQRRDQALAAPPAGRGRRLHRHRRAHGRHRRDPQHQGVRGGEGPGVLPRAQGGQPRRPGLGARAGRARARAEKADAVLVSQVVTQRDAHLLNTREMSAAFREAYPAARAAAAGRRRTPLRRDDGRRARRRPGLHPRHHPRRGGVSFIVHRLTASGPDTARRWPHDGRRRRHPVVTHRRYVPYSHAHYAGNLVDGAYSPRPVRRRGDRDVHPAPTATRGCSRRTPTCSSARRCAPATSSRSPRAGPGRHPLPRAGLRGPRRRRVAPRPPDRPGAAAVLDRAAAGHHRDRHGRRARRSVTPVPVDDASPARRDASATRPACRARHAVRLANQGKQLVTDGTALTCGFAHRRRSGGG